MSHFDQEKPGEGSEHEIQAMTQAFGGCPGSSVGVLDMDPLPGTKEGDGRMAFQFF